MLDNSPNVINKVGTNLARSTRPPIASLPAAEEEGEGVVEVCLAVVTLQGPLAL